MTIPPWQFQRAYTPELIKRLIQITCAVTLVSVTLDQWLGLQQLFALTPLTYTSLYLWQPITSLFLLPSPLFSFGFLIDFVFTMLIFWLFGSLVLERIGKRRFLVAYFASGLLSGLSALVAMHYFGLFTTASELLPMILAITTLWSMSDPHQEILLFFILPIKARWVLVVALLGTLFVSFVQHDLISFAAYFTAFLFSYLYGLVSLGFASPFSWMQGVDRFLGKIQRFWQWRIMESWRRYSQARKMREEEFVDRTLEKISKVGESSLHIHERLRLKWISFKKRIFS